ncbi:M16 family metallopeptidase [Ornithinicoccus hortensis]|uniref:Putative Zn-dependent peptidase n=1 Tax=Ornithinicoccus hortensis TaxID=82346 RepID=A0A542YQ05_9MICO|nr:pitrilysin family protein [Ornithinicoccus hortensis]TQL50185.1 putative Zn-dependent peptidase [Ornithinicoccus hortensis]
MTTATPLPARPGVRPPAAWSFPVPEVFTLDNGLSVQTFHLPGQHVVSVRLGIPAPLAAEPVDVEGVATILSRTLDEGTEAHDAEEMAGLLERKGVFLGAGVGERGILVDLDVAVRNLGAGLELLTECLTTPTFPEEEVARHVRNRIADIRHDLADPMSRAALEFLPTYFRPSSRASRPSGGSLESVAAITSEAVRAHHRRMVHPDRSHLVVAGDLTGVDVPALLGQTLSAWAPGGADEGAPPAGGDERADDAARIVLVDRPGSVQTDLYLGCSGPDRRDPHGWGAYQVLSLAVGGSPQSRLDRVLREEKGYTYGVHAGFRPRTRGGLFLVSGSVRADATVPALDTLLDLLAMPGSDLTEAEVREAADFVAQTAPGRYATADVLAGEAIGLAMDGLATDFVTRTLTQVRTMDAATAGAAWDAHVDGRWTVIAVGDAAAHGSAIEALGRGPVEVRRSGGRR